LKAEREEFSECEDEEYLEIKEEIKKLIVYPLI
jgi:hypothetical protein